MNQYERLKTKQKEAYNKVIDTLDETRKIADECERVRNVARDIETIYSNLEQEFINATKLTKTDVSFLFLATALQCVRQYVIPNDWARMSHTEGEKLVKKPIDKAIKKTTGEDKGQYERIRELLLGGVPYDAVKYSGEFKNIGFKTGIGGSTHRYRTLGHDPILGWFFGTVNILTNSMTTSDIVTTYTINSSSISGIYPSGTIGAVYDAIQTIKDTPVLLPAAVAKQAIHFGSDYFTKQGLPIPFMGTLSPELAEISVTKFNIDIRSIARGALLSTLINLLIECIHQLLYDESVPMDLYKIRTNKIISYSNLIATSSNAIYVAISKDLKKLDVGGMVVTLHNLLKNRKFQQAVLQEFVEKKLYEIVMGDVYEQQKS